MPRIICIVIPSARPRDLYCAAWRDGMQVTHIWSFSLRIRNAWVVTVSWRILKNRARRRWIESVYLQIEMQLPLALLEEISLL